ncbi:unnamed protein product [Rotaria sp. Silwood2]|nr:unnamed protein product [Rotaria sp. Silwood2]CAF4230826.1 unnamed protein product [Rotaria sp. Silwood2]
MLVGSIALSTHLYDADENTRKHNITCYLEPTNHESKTGNSNSICFKTVITLTNDRKAEEKHIPSFVKYFNNPILQPNSLTIPYPYTTKDGEDFIQKIKLDSLNLTRIFTIRLRTSTELIGECGLDRSVKNEKRTEIGYWLNESYWHRGLMPKVVRIVIEVIKNEWKNLVRIEAQIFPWNKASMRVAEKCGFVFEEVLHFLVMANDTDVNHREIFQLHIGSAGIEIDHRCWELYCLEHNLAANGCINDENRTNHITCSMRFEGCLLADLNEFQTALIPFPTLKLVSSFLSPLIPFSHSIHSDFKSPSVYQMSVPLFSQSNTCFVHQLTSYKLVLATTLLYRGKNIIPKEIGQKTDYGYESMVAIF